VAPSAKAGRWIDEGNAWAGQGRLAKAEKAYRRALRAQPDYAEALSNLGSVLQAGGKLAEAEEAYRQALALATGNLAITGNLGVVLDHQGKREAAEECYRVVLESDPANPAILGNLAALLSDSGRNDEAQATLAGVLEIEPENAKGHARMARLQLADGDAEAALASARRALALDPNLAEAHFEAGNAHGRLKEPEQAIAAYLQAVELNPEFIEAHFNLGNLLRDEIRGQEAVEAYLKVLAIRPDEIGALGNLGVIYRYLDRLSEAAELNRRILALDARNYRALVNLGLVLVESGDADGALECYDRALALRPYDAHILGNRAEPLMIKQQFTAGWEAYEYRWTGERQRRPFYQEQWQGQDLAGKSLLVWGEQGIGDNILFATCLLDLKGRPRQCLLETQARLVPLLARSFPDWQVVAATDPPHALAGGGDLDYQVPIASLPRILRPNLESFPDHQGFLVADAERQTHWRAWLEGLGSGPNVGICWRSGLSAVDRVRDQVPLLEWQSVLATPDVRFVNLQYDRPEEEIAAVAEAFGVTIHNPPEIDLRDDIDDLVALMSCLDLVLAPLVANVWFAGGAGVPVWVHTRISSWQMFGTGRYPWMPSVRPFLRQADEDWDAVLDRMAVALRQI
jgi:tetratricopeptide (TPR) repeat protein